MMRNPIAFVVLLGGLAAVGWAEDNVPFDRNFSGRITDPVQVCMNKRTIQPHTAYKEEYQGKTYHFCCTMCQSKFKANPEEERWGTDPVKGKKVDKADALLYSYKGKVFFFDSKRSLKKFAKHPTKYLDQ